VKKVIAYTDGSCSVSTGDGGYGAILYYKEHEREIYGGVAHTTSNRMEITAVIKVLETLTEPCKVDIYSDSLYVVNAFDKDWISKWLKLDFRSIKNADLWQSLLELTRRHTVKFHWVKGHNGTPQNERADELAEKGRLLSKDSKKRVK
jgi:ribonuclease HI